MTVKELISNLHEYPQTAEVFIQITRDEDVPITQVIYDHENEQVIIETE